MVVMWLLIVVMADVVVLKLLTSLPDLFDIVVIVAWLRSQQHAGVFQRRICSED